MAIEFLEPRILQRVPVELPFSPQLVELPDRLYHLEDAPITMDLMERVVFNENGANTLMLLLSAVLDVNAVREELISGIAHLTVMPGISKFAKNILAPFPDDGLIALLDNPITLDITNTNVGGVPTTGRLGFFWESLTPSEIIAKAKLNLYFKLYSLDFTPANV